MHNFEQRLAERRIWALEEELKLKREELKFKIDQEMNKSNLASPLGIAVIGGLLALMTSVIGGLVQGMTNTHVQSLQQQATEKLQRQKQESDLIHQAIDTDGDNHKTRENLKFFLDVGLIENEALRKKLDSGEYIPQHFTPDNKVETETVRLHFRDAHTVAQTIRGFQEPQDCENYPMTYLPDLASVDRVLQTQITAIDKRTLFLRGPRGGIRMTKEMIWQIDASKEQEQFVPFPKFE